MFNVPYCIRKKATEPLTYTLNVANDVVLWFINFNFSTEANSHTVFYLFYDAKSFVYVIWSVLIIVFLRLAQSERLSERN